MLILVSRDGLSAHILGENSKIQAIAEGKSTAYKLHINGDPFGDYVSQAIALEIMGKIVNALKVHTGMWSFHIQAEDACADENPPVAIDGSSCCAEIVKSLYRIWAGSNGKER